MVKDEKEIPIANISGEIVSGSVYISALASARPGSNMIYSMENKRGFFLSLMWYWSLSTECFLLLDGEKLRWLSFQGGAEYNLYNFVKFYLFSKLKI